MSSIEVLRARGLMDYDYAAALMNWRVNQVIAGRAPELLWLLEHNHVYTVGSGTDMQEEMCCIDTIDNSSFTVRDHTRYGAIPVIKTGRGGKITYHGPGQRVLYLVIDLRHGLLDVRNYMRSLEMLIIRALGAINIAGWQKPGCAGVWVGEKKIASVGVRVRKWVTFHGIALNVRTDMDVFAGITPCGLPSGVMTSICQIVCGDIDMQQIDNHILAAIPEFMYDLGRNKVFELL